MLELSFSQYPLVRPLFEAMDIHLPLKAILAGDVAAPVWVDALDAPRLALTWTGHRFYLAGAPNGEENLAAARHIFLEQFRPQALAHEKDVYELFPSPAWDQAMQAMLGDLRPLRLGRQYYELKEMHGDRCSMLPDGFELRQVNTALLADERIKNPEYLTEEMLSERPSVDEFCQKSFGVCLVHADEIIGWCLSEYNTGERCEVGIATRQDFHRRGFATLMTHALVDLARSRGVRRVGWHCWADNLPSSATALKAGFVKVADYPSYLGWFDQAIHLANCGYEAFQHEQAAEALEYFELGMGLGDLPVWAYWWGACAATRLDQPETALRYLHLALDHGFRDGDRLRSSPYLASLHDQPGWQALLDRLAVD